MNNMKQLGKSIKAIRLMRNMSQDDVANAIGMTRGYVSKIEIGLREPGWNVICAIAKALGVSATLIVALSEKDEPTVAITLALLMQQALTEG